MVQKTVQKTAGKTMQKMIGMQKWLLCCFCIPSKNDLFLSKFVFSVHFLVLKKCPKNGAKNTQKTD
jgi:hypothetical protein